jgi:transcriptional accessory protein Tex/SPT6
MNNQELAIAQEITSEAIEPAVEVAAEAPANSTPTDSLPAESSSDESGEASPEGGTSDIYGLKVGQRLTGVVKNIADFGAFVDVGIPQDGLVHISKLAKHKVEKVSDVVSEGQEVEVWVKKVDTQRGRLSLTMVKPVLRRLRDIEENQVLEGTVTRLEAYGAFVDIDSDRDGLVHISQITHDYIKHPEETLKVGDRVTVKVININRKKRQVDLSIKALLPEPVKEVKEVPLVVDEKYKPQRDERHRSSRQRSAKQQQEESFVIVDDEPRVTAMAVAYAALQNKEDDRSDEAADQLKSKANRNKTMDEIIARTLAGRDK